MSEAIHFMFSRVKGSFSGAAGQTVFGKPALGIRMPCFESQFHSRLQLIAKADPERQWTMASRSSVPVTQWDAHSVAGAWLQTGRIQ